MTRIGPIWLIPALAVAALPGAAASKEKVKVKRERALAVLPVRIEAPSEPSRTYSFREGDFWGWQAARYRSAVRLDSPAPLPELWREAAIPVYVPG